MEASIQEGEATVWGLQPRSWGLVLVALHVFLGLLLFEPTLFTGGDNAGYMILADALRSGEGYRDLYLPDAPLHARYPPGYPVLLAVLGTVGGLQLFKLFSLACTAGAVWLTHRLARTRLAEGTALAAAGLVALNPVLLEYSHYELSEAPFLVAVMAALAAFAAGHVLGGSDDALPSIRWLGGLGSAVAAFLVRTAALPLVGAVWLYHLSRRQWRRLVASVAVGGGAVGGWALYQRAVGTEGQSYLQQLVMRNPYDPAAGTAGPAELLTRAARNLWLYTSEVLPRSVLGEPLAADGGTLVAAVGLLVTALVVTGWLASANRGLGLPELFLPLYAALILVWPDEWTDRRFLLPLLPLALIYAGAGLEAAARRWQRVTTRGATGGLLALTLPALAAVLLQAPDRIRCTTAYWRGSPCVAAAWTSFYDAARWATETTPEDAVIVNRKPRIFYWISRRRGDVYPYSREPSVVLAELKSREADFVVVDQLFSTTAAYLMPAVQASADRFEVVYGEGEPRTFILRFRRRPPAAAAPVEQNRLPGDRRIEAGEAR